MFIDYRPPGFPTVTPFMIVEGANDLIAFLEATFGATRKEYMADSDGSVKHAEIRIGDRTMRRLSILLTLLFVVGMIASAGAQTANTLTLEEGENGQTASIEDVSFLVGHWQGEGMGGFNEEIWGQPLGGSMLAIFRHLQSDEPSFSEIMQIAEEDGTLALRLKHFNADLTGWETQDDMVTFPLVRIEPGEAAYFRGLTYKRVTEDQLTIYLALHNRDGVQEVSFELHRVDD